MSNSPTYPLSLGPRQTNKTSNPLDPLNFLYKPTTQKEIDANFRTSVSDAYTKSLNKTDELGLGLLVKVVDKAEGSKEGQGSLAKKLYPFNGEKQLINVISQLKWTVSKHRADVPYVSLIEHEIDGGLVGRQVEFYTRGVTESFANFFEAGSKAASLLSVYDEIFIRNTTGWQYKFPYFSKVHYELTTNAWEKFDKISQSVTDIGGGLSTILGGKDSKLGIISDVATKVFEAAKGTAETALAFKYPVVGIADRPRIFTGHGERSLTIEFPLYNTFEPNDWRMNREFIFLFQNQNLFNKRNFITGLPPVWYEVHVPGQYYSVASCVTNFKVENLGNTRIMKIGSGKDFIVPDAYQVSITLQEMAMPSSNQFQAAVNGEASKRVTTSTRATESSVDAASRVVERVTTGPTVNVPGIFQQAVRDFGPALTRALGQ